jgi:hypothetical protein
MKTLKNNILFLLIILFPFIGISQEEKADAVYDKLTREFVLNEDGTMEYHYYKELKILTHFAFHRLFGETFIIYDPTYQELIINEAYTIMADGKRVDAPENAFNEVLPRFARDIPAFSPLREMVVTHTGLEVGAVIVLDYTITTRDPFIPYMMGYETIGENVPVKEMKIAVEVPVDVALHHKMLNLRTGPEIQEMGSSKRYTWSYGYRKANSMESYQDPDLTPRLIFSTAKDMGHAYFSLVDQPAFRHQLGPELSKKVEEVIDEGKDDVGKMLALQDVVLNEMNTANIPFEYTGYKLRTPAEAWQAANATPLEKAVMLSDMLVEAGINALPVAIIPDIEYDRTMGCLLCFEKFLVQVNPREKGRFYLSVDRKNDQNLIYDLEGSTALQLDGAIESLRTFNEQAESNDDAIRLEGEMVLTSPELMTGEIIMGLKGVNHPYLKVSRNQDAVKSLLSGGLPSSSVTSYEISKLTEGDCQVDFSVEIKDPLQETGGYYFLDLPALSIGIAQHNLAGMSDNRETPLKLPVDIDEEYSFTIQLKEGWQMITPANKIKIENEAGMLEIEVTQKKDKLVIGKSIRVDRDISIQQYPDLLDLVRTWSDERYNRLMLEAGE